MKINFKQIQEKYGAKAKALLDDESKLNQLIEASVQKVDNLDKSDKLEKIWQRLLLLLGLIKDWASGAYPKVPKKSLVLIAIALLYLVNPLDLIPDVLPIIGHVDDIAVFAFVIKQIIFMPDKVFL